MSTVKKRRNTALEFWRFFTCFIIMGYHLAAIMPRITDGVMLPSAWCTGGGETLFIFTLTSGYFLVSAFHSKTNKDLSYAQRSAASRAWEYLAGRLKTLLPALILGILLGIVSLALWRQATPVETVGQVINGLWEFLGAYSLGFTAAFGQSNSALWFISSLFICSYFLYYMLCKNRDFTVGLLAPAIFFVLEGWWSKMGIRASQAGWSMIGEVYYASAGTSGSGAVTGIAALNNGLLFVLVGMCGGIMMYYAVDRLKNVQLSRTAETLLGVLYAVLSVVMIAYCVNPTWFGSLQLERMTVHLLCFVLVTLTLLQKDPVSRLLNCDALSKVLGYLGGVSLQVYMVHLPFIYFVIMLLGRNNTYTFGQVFPLVVVSAMVVAAALKVVMDKSKAKRAKA